MKEESVIGLVTVKSTVVAATLLDLPCPAKFRIEEEVVEVEAALCAFTYTLPLVPNGNVGLVPVPIGEVPAASEYHTYEYAAFGLVTLPVFGQLIVPAAVTLG